MVSSSSLGRANGRQLVLIPKLDGEDHSGLEQTSGVAERTKVASDMKEVTMEQCLQRTLDVGTVLWSSWTIEGWFRSKVSSIGAGQTSTMAHQDHNSHVVSGGPDQDHNSYVLRDELSFLSHKEGSFGRVEAFRSSVALTFLMTIGSGNRSRVAPYASQHHPKKIAPVSTEAEIDKNDLCYVMKFNTSTNTRRRAAKQPLDEEAPLTSSKPLKEKDVASTYSEHIIT
ncbi:hypothetical protein Tco_1458384 [Tanacetum coccineum]